MLYPSNPGESLVRILATFHWPLANRHLARRSMSNFLRRPTFSGVEPRGFEPLTSAVQRRYELSVCVLARPRVWLKQAYFRRLKG